jgi:hypothetical protein
MELPAMAVRRTGIPASTVIASSKPLIYKYLCYLARSHRC